VGNAAVVAGDRITGDCAVHTVPSPTGAPMPAPAPLPFAAPLATALASTVTIEGRLAAVQGSTGLNVPPHPGLHPGDPFLAPPTQQGRVVTGSGTVRFDGRPAAYTGCPVTVCAAVAGRVTGTATTVSIGA